MCSNPVHGHVYSMQHYVMNLTVTCGRSVIFTSNKTDHLDITDILLKMAITS